MFLSKCQYLCNETFSFSDIYSKLIQHIKEKWEIAESSEEFSIVFSWTSFDNIL